MTKQDKDKTKKKPAGFCIADMEVDSTSSLEGRWFKYQSGAELLIARWENENFARYQQKLLMKDARAIRRGDKVVDPKVQREAVARTILLGWRGIADPDGNDVEYSPLTALTYFELAPSFYEDVCDFAQDENNFRKAQMGNLPTASSGV